MPVNLLAMCVPVATAWLREYDTQTALATQANPPRAVAAEIKRVLGLRGTPLVIPAAGAAARGSVVIRLGSDSDAERAKLHGSHASPSVLLFGVQCTIRP